MELKDQVCTLDQVKRLKELGFVTDSVNRYNNLPEGTDYSMQVISETFGLNDFPAYSLSELLNCLPVNTSVTKGGKKYHCRYWWGDPLSGVLREQVKGSSSNDWHQTTDENPAKACADMLIFLLENKLVTP